MNSASHNSTAATTSGQSFINAMLAAARAIQTQPDEVQAAVTLAVTSPTDAAMAVIKPARKLIGGLISGGTVEGGDGEVSTSFTDLFSTLSDRFKDSFKSASDSKFFRLVQTYANMTGNMKPSAGQLADLLRGPLGDLVAGRLPTVDRFNETISRIGYAIVNVPFAVTHADPCLVSVYAGRSCRSLESCILPCLVHQRASSRRTLCARLWTTGSTTL